MGSFPETRWSIRLLDVLSYARNLEYKQWGIIGHFRVLLGLRIKARLSAQPLKWKRVFILMQLKLTFTRTGCALGLILKLRVFGTRKWPIHFTNFGIMNTHVRWVKASKLILSHKQRKYRVYARRKVRGCAGGRQRAGGTLLLSSVLPQHQAHQKPALSLIKASATRKIAHAKAFIFFSVNLCLLLQS